MKKYDDVTLFVHNMSTKKEKKPHGIATKTIILKGNFPPEIIVERVKYAVGAVKRAWLNSGCIAVVCNRTLKKDARLLLREVETINITRLAKLISSLPDKCKFNATFVFIENETIADYTFFCNGESIKICYQQLMEEAGNFDVMLAHIHGSLDREGKLVSKACNLGFCVQVLPD